MDSFDYLILGQGLAGTAIAWQLLIRGCTVCVIDREEASTSSKIAAGLMTPITGQRLVAQDRWPELLQTATAFYNQIERITQTQLFFPRGMVRIFADERERGIYAKRLHGDFLALCGDPLPPLDPAIFQQPLGAFALPSAAQLLCDRYLAVSREHFTRHCRYIAADVDIDAEAVVSDHAVALPGLGVGGRKLICCRGFGESSNRRFHAGWQAAKGEILTLRIPGLTEERVVNRGVWLARAGDGIYKAGASYAWNEFDSVPTSAKREEIEARLRIFLNLPFEVLEQQAGVRPILTDQKPVVGYDSTRPPIAYFNGLGSKGALFAPWMAERLAESLTKGTDLPVEFDLRRFGDPLRCRT